jgi:alpha-beta hydrolase superfamily lysophospholipase
MPKEYTEQVAWKEIQNVLPESYHFSKDYHPTEEWWDWKGNNIHLDTFRNPDAKAKVVMLHGVGTNGRQMSMILGGPLSKDNLEIIAIDMPTYGLSVVDPSHTITYDDWIQLGSDYIDYELEKDDRPVFIYGLSAGGMETYDVAATNGKVKGIIGMTFLDQQSADVRHTTAHDWFMGHIATPMLHSNVQMGMGKVKIPMKVASKMYTLCNDPEAMKAFLRDETSAGNSVTIKFLDSYMNHHVVVEPEKFNVCPIMLTQPDADRWTPFRLSKPFLDRVKNVPVRIEHLDNGGHYPVEAVALKQLHENALDFILKNMPEE